MNCLSNSEIDALLTIEDLSDNPNHAIAQIAQTIQLSIAALYPTLPIVVLKGERVVNAAHNYKLLGYPEDNITQSNVYTKWVDTERILRTQTTSLVLEYLLQWRTNPHPTIVLAPGMVYRRDVRDRWHCANPHQMDVWVLGVEASDQTLLRSIEAITQSIDQSPIARDTVHPYTMRGQEISAMWNKQELEIGEGGLIAHSLLERLNIERCWGGLAMGWGLDRLVMIKKQLPDIRLLRDPLPSIAQQMTHLKPWKPISRQPSATRQISILHNAENEEDVVEQILNAVPHVSHRIQEISLVSRTHVKDLPPVAQERLGVAQADQNNLLIKIVWQDEAHSLARKDVNSWTRSVYQSLHQGTNWEYLP